MMQAQIVECPSCGRSLSPEMKNCPACGNAIIISSFTSVASMPLPTINKYANAYRNALQNNPDDKTLNNAVGMCYLKLKLYDKAIPAFEKAIEDNFDNAETFFYAAVCLLKGKKAFLAQRPEINKIENYLNAACMIEPKGAYYLFWAYIKKDYYERKFLNSSPKSGELLQQAIDCGCSNFDKEQLFSLLTVESPF